MAYLVRFKTDDELESAEREMWASYVHSKLLAHGLPGPGIDRLLDGTPAPVQITTALAETFTKNGTKGGLMILDSTGRAHLPASAEASVMRFGPAQLESKYAAIYEEATAPADIEGGGGGGGGGGDAMVLVEEGAQDVG